MSMSKSQRKLGIPLQRDSGHLDTATVATGKVEKIFAYGSDNDDDEYTALPYGSSPSWPDSFHSTGITISSKHLGGKIEQITTFTTAFDVIISSRIITVSPDRGTPQWANCKNRGLSYNPYKPPQGQPIHFDFYLHLTTSVIDIFNAPKKTS